MQGIQDKPQQGNNDELNTGGQVHVQNPAALSRCLRDMPANCIRRRGKAKTSMIQHKTFNKNSSVAAIMSDKKVKELSNENSLEMDSWNRDRPGSGRTRVRRSFCMAARRLYNAARTIRLQTIPTANRPGQSGQFGAAK